MLEEQIKAACPSCGNKMFFNSKLALSKQKCSSCNYTFTVPKPFGLYVLQSIKANDEFSNSYNALNKIGELCRIRIFNNMIKDSMHAQEALKLSVQKVEDSTNKHLLKVNETFTLQENFCIEYEFIKNTLKGTRQKENLSAQRCLELSLKLLEAYAAVQKEGIILSNIKPSTITLEDDEFKFYDANVSWSAALELSKKTPGFNPINNHHYVAPEVIVNRQVSHKSDIYSLVCIIFELFTNRTPFASANTNNEVLEAHKNLKAHSIRDLKPNLPESLDRLILGGLEKDPNHRPLVEDLIDDLKRVDLNPSKEILKEFAPHSQDTLVVRKTEDIDLNLLASERYIDSSEPISKDLSHFETDLSLNEKKQPIQLIIVIVLIILVATLLFLFKDSLIGDKEERKSLSKSIELSDEIYRRN
jgi:serine/threonine protein kinase